MLLNIVSATITYADYALIGLAALLFLAGLFRGFSKTLYGFFFSILIVLAGFYITGIAADPLIKSNVGQQYFTAIDNASNGWGDAFTKEIYFQGGVPYITPSNGTEPVQLSSVVGTNPVVKILVEQGVPRVVPPEGGLSLKDVLVPNIVYISSYIVVFILAVIAMKIAFRVIESVWDKITNKGKRLKFLDKLMGGAMSFVYTGAFALFVLAIIGTLAEKPWIAPAVDMIKASEYCGWLFLNNPVTTIFIRLFVG